MKFTLLFYTDGWEPGPSIELMHVPSPGSVVWTAGKRRGEEGDMYYVDNVMYPEYGLEPEDTIYLYVRPYTGYAKYAPMTETDRIAEKLVQIKDEVQRLRSILQSLGEAALSFYTSLGGFGMDMKILKDSVAGSGETLSNAVAQLLRFADAIEDGQQEQIGKLEDLALALEEVKERL